MTSAELALLKWDSLELRIFQQYIQWFKELSSICFKSLAQYEIARLRNYENSWNCELSCRRFISQQLQNGESSLKSSCNSVIYAICLNCLNYLNYLNDLKWLRHWSFTRSNFIARLHSSWTPTMKQWSSNQESSAWLQIKLNFHPIISFAAKRQYAILPSVPSTMCQKMSNMETCKMRRSRVVKHNFWSIIPNDDLYDKFPPHKPPSPTQLTKTSNNSL